MGNTVSELNCNNIILITYNTKIDYYSKYKCNKIINYLSNYKDKNSIICLQGLNDAKSREDIMMKISPYFKENNIIPSSINEVKNNGHMIMTNLQINNIESKEFDIDNNIFEYNRKMVLITDIKILTNLITVYNTELYEDISNNVILGEYRKKQITQLINIIKDKMKKNKNGGMHIVLGSFYTNKIDDEYLVDIVTHYNSELKSNGGDYVLFFMEKFDEEVFAQLKKEFGVEIAKIFVRDELNYSDHSPIEVSLKFIE